MRMIQLKLGRYWRWVGTETGWVLEVVWVLWGIVLILYEVLEVGILMIRADVKNKQTNDL